MPLTKSQLIVISIIVGVILVFVLIFVGIIPGLKSREEGPTQIQATLNFWVFSDGQTIYESAFNGFKNIYPNVKINFQSFSSQKEYENAVLNALAAGAGPDIFMLQNGALFKEFNKISPVPALKYSLVPLRNQFPQVVEQDFVYQGQIYALPLSIDTLALIYNRDIFNQNGVALPPATWEELQGLMPKFFKQDELRRIALAGAAIGGSKKTINTASDILNLLMLQKGTAMLVDSRPSFASEAGVKALEFYVQFANAASSYYTWNDTMSNAFDFFSQEKAAIMFEYSSALTELKSRNPLLNFNVAPIPQFAQSQKPVAQPRYWGYTVARQSRYQDIAWDFIIYLTTNSESARIYTEQTQKPPALNFLINQKVNDPQIGVFAKQALIAKSWQMTDPLAVSNIFSEAIEAVITGRLTVTRALKQAEEQFINL